MKSERFFCKRCRRYFDAPRFYNEKHGIDNPPYERLAVCPLCDGDDFLKFSYVIEKIEVAEKLLPAIMHFNRYLNALKDIFGDKFKNTDLSDGVELTAELVCEMFDFFDVDIQRKILNVDDDKELNRILICLKGEI